MSFARPDAISKEHVLRKTASSALPQKSLKELHFALCDSADFREDYLRCFAKDYKPKHPDGFSIPYFDLDGNVTSFGRMRQLAEPLPLDKRGKKIRYRQPNDTVPSVYMPPVLDVTWREVANTPDIPLVITEGELKAASVCYNTEFPCVGLGGVWSWRSAKHQYPLLPVLAEFNWQARDVYIVYDSDVEDKIDVQRAQSALARVLSMRGAKVFICRLPPLSTGEKCGVDDFILENGGVALRAVMEKAEPFMDNETLYRINDSCVYCRNPSMVILLRQDGQDVFSEMSTRVFQYERFSNLRHEVMKQTADGKVYAKEVSSTEAWMQWAGRLEVNGIAFEPGRERFLDTENPRSPNYMKLNAWNGWGVEPAAGAMGPFHRLLDHIFGGDREARDFFLKWAAFPIQNPGAKMYCGVILWSIEHGTGKSWIMRMLRELYGEHGRLVADDKLFQNFNYWAHRAQFVVVDELAKQLDYGKTSEKLKRLITQDKVTVHMKYLPEIEYRDCTNYGFTSNDPDCWRLDDDDRRAFVHHVKAGHLPEWQVEELRDWWDHGPGPAALMHYLRHEVSTVGFTQSTRPPLNESKRNMIEISKSDLDIWVRQLWEDADSVLQLDGRPVKYALWGAEELLKYFDPERRFESRYSMSSMATALQKRGFRKVYGGAAVRTIDGPKRLWAIRDAETLLLRSGPELAEAYASERGAKSVVKQAKFGRK